MLTRAIEPAVEAHYARCCVRDSAIRPHLPRLRDLASDCTLAVEFGVQRAASSAALLMGADRLISYDLVQTAEALDLYAAVGDTRWQYRFEDSRRCQVHACDLLFIDSRHTYEQMAAELERHADAVGRWLVCHDTLTFGSVGADGETGRQRWTYTAGQSVPLDKLGIRPAIDALQIRDPSWRIAAHYTDSHGLLVLERR